MATGWARGGITVSLKINIFFLWKPHISCNEPQMFREFSRFKLKFTTEGFWESDASI